MAPCAALERCWAGAMDGARQCLALCFGGGGHGDEQGALLGQDGKLGKYGEAQGAKPSGAEAGAADEERDKVVKAFVIAHHDTLGYLVLKAFKNRKGIHGQLPGGNLDFDDASPAFGAAREVFEETGIDLRANLARLRLAVFPDGTTQLKGRQFFRLTLTDADAVGDRAPDSGEDFRLNLSDEHVGFVFEKDAENLALMIDQHSGGKCSRAVRALECV
ncbi:Hypothetical Protein FCC1311_013202 [Hondaea fermentalgiana]|uniref:Nudix hydrolase domain-containing protein n=1 Tax=Hondaea fermentalgiana TaxID=2315210 RepID=A0A2R5G9D5_9STRA|nr:Hypothetical Protein FCC1311_013202 [Hondaea fermentalgiana]|eukprot:GBG25103.1 Hypothetical Protein FCC1311_013202 [Hondaea fermentalgiana]